MRKLNKKAGSLSKARSADRDFHSAEFGNSELGMFVFASPIKLWKRNLKVEKEKIANQRS